VPTAVEGDYEWDQQKAELNRVKHGVTFSEAVIALEDPWAIVVVDEVHGDRDITFGLTPKGVLVVVSTERGRRTRIISARRATNHEEHGYQAQQQR
jgi:uncharacterized DUF497 family protein